MRLFIGTFGKYTDKKTGLEIWANVWDACSNTYYIADNPLHAERAGESVLCIKDEVVTDRCKIVNLEAVHSIVYDTRRDCNSNIILLHNREMKK